MRVREWSAYQRGRYSDNGRARDPKPWTLQDAFYGLGCVAGVVTGVVVAWAVVAAVVAVVVWWWR